MCPKLEKCVKNLEKCVKKLEKCVKNLEKCVKKLEKCVKTITFFLQKWGNPAFKRPRIKPE